MKKNYLIPLILVIILALGYRAYRSGWRPFGNDSGEVVVEISPTPIIKKGIDGRDLYPADEITNHAKEENCWITLNGKIYDITQYLRDNPDEKELRNSCGKEVTNITNISTIKKSFTYLGDVYFPGSK